MYDGYYIYSPTYVPQTITDSATSLKNNATGGNINDIEQGNGKQLFYYENGPTDKKLTNSAIQTINGVETVGKPIYEAKDGEGQQEIFSFSTSKNNIVETKKITIKFTTDRNKAKTTYKHVLKTFVPYTTNYTKDGTNYVINYTLDNYIRIYKDDEAWEGYIITEYGDETKYNVPVKSTTVTFDGTTIEPEKLSENIPVRNSRNDNIEVKNYAYIYNSNNDKRYYESEAGENQGKFFITNSEYVKVYLPDAEVNNSLAEYKKLLIRFKENWPEYIELYQLLNKDEGNTWYYKDSNGKYNRYSNYQPTIDKNKDCSAINYYVENYLFNFWLNDERLNTNEIMSQKKQSIIDNVNRNLNLAISNYSENSKINYTIPELSDEDWEQALSNISMITFFQGMKVGLKTYNNYSVVTSSENNEYVGENSLYFVQEQDKYYHRRGCSKCVQPIDIYRNTEFKVQSYIAKDGDVKYYYEHKYIDEGRTNGIGIYKCFDCIVNRNNMQYEEFNNIAGGYYLTALARERYIQMSRARLTNGKGKIIEEQEPEENTELQLIIKVTAEGTQYSNPTSIEVEKGQNVKFEAIATNGSGDYVYTWNNDTIQATVGNGQTYTFTANDETKISCGVGDRITRKTIEKSCTIKIKEQVLCQHTDKYYYGYTKEEATGIGRRTITTYYHKEKCRNCEWEGDEVRCSGTTGNYSYDQNYHWTKCTTCGQEIYKTKHLFFRKICKTCGYRKDTM